MKIAEREKNKQIVRQLLRTGMAWHNSLKCSSAPAERPEHCNVKYMLMQYCLSKGLDFWTEATFQDGSGRADFIISDWKLVIEVLHTEEVKNFKNKKYPLMTIAIKSNANVFVVQEMLDDLSTTNGTAAEFYRNKMLMIKTGSQILESL